MGKQAGEEVESAPKELAEKAHDALTEIWKKTAGAYGHDREDVDLFCTVRFALNALSGDEDIEGKEALEVVATSPEPLVKCVTCGHWPCPCSCPCCPTGHCNTYENGQMCSCMVSHCVYPEGGAEQNARVAQWLVAQWLEETEGNHRSNGTTESGHVVIYNDLALDSDDA